MITKERTTKGSEETIQTNRLPLEKRRKKKKKEEYKERERKKRTQA
jgi:hypothetical protein